jgi:DNA-binding IclR family transcriptional regulator
MFKKVKLVLEALERIPLSAKEVSQKTSMPLPTIYRHLTELQQYGFTTKQKNLYQLTAKGRQLLELLKNSQL